MSLRFFNTLTRQVEEFSTREPGKVAMYTCGPTVYNRAHIGNFRTFLFTDLVQRYLRYRGYDVLAVMNITDVDDRIIKMANETGKPPAEITRFYTDAFFADRDRLGIVPANIYPRATEHINEMVEIVRCLAGKGMAYEADGSWYFKVSEFPDYGHLARLDVEGMQQVERVAGDQYAKRDPRDFALWKGWEPDDGDVVWDTPIGRGRPGWHLECSAMSLKYLGEDFDIHLGGVDLIFPHHQNEVAQTEGCTGHRLARYWLHSEFLMINADKMSKSLGNFYTLEDILNQGWKPREVRFALLNAHYRQQLNFTHDGLEAARAALERIDACLRNLHLAEGQGGAADLPAVLEKYEAEFQAALDDDLNYPNALAALFNLIREINSRYAESKIGRTEADLALEALRRLDTVFGFLEVDKTEESDEEIEALIEARNAARKARDWAEADRIRKLLAEADIILEDRPGSTVWRRK